VFSALPAQFPRKYLALQHLVGSIEVKNIAWATLALQKPTTNRENLWFNLCSKTGNYTECSIILAISIVYEAPLCTSPWSMFK